MTLITVNADCSISTRSQNMYLRTP